MKIQQLSTGAAVLFGAFLGLSSTVLANNGTTHDPPLDLSHVKQCGVDLLAVDIVKTWEIGSPVWYDAEAIFNVDTSITKETHDFYIKKVYDILWLGAYCRKPTKDAAGNYGSVHCCVNSFGWVHISIEYETKDKWLWDQCLHLVQEVNQKNGSHISLPEIKDFL